MLALYYRGNLAAKLMGFPVPKYGILIEKNVMIPVWDGTKLATDIYRPNSEGNYPILFMRTPYDKTNPDHHYAEFAKLFSQQGYVVAVQDVRGKYASEGVFEPYVNEGDDGYDSLEWLGRAPWSNGNIAMAGFSYLGSCAWLELPAKAST